MPLVTWAPLTRRAPPALTVTCPMIRDEPARHVVAPALTVTGPVTSPTRVVVHAGGGAVGLRLDIAASAWMRPAPTMLGPSVPTGMAVDDIAAPIWAGVAVGLKLRRRAAT